MVKNRFRIVPIQERKILYSVVDRNFADTIFRPCSVLRIYSKFLVKNFYFLRFKRIFLLHEYAFCYITKKNHNEDSILLYIFFFPLNDNVNALEHKRAEKNAFFKIMFIYE